MQWGHFTLHAALVYSGRPMIRRRETLNWPLTHSDSLALSDCYWLTAGVGLTDSKRPNAAICDFHNDGPTPCEEANRRNFIDACCNVSYILPCG